jgi:hypothetical protein
MKQNHNKLYAALPEETKAGSSGQLSQQEKWKGGVDDGGRGMPRSGMPESGIKRYSKCTVQYCSL